MEGQLLFSIRMRNTVLMGPATGPPAPVPASPVADGEELPPQDVMTSPAHETSTATDKVRVCMAILPSFAFIMTQNHGRGPSFTPTSHKHSRFQRFFPLASIRKG